jgi:integrase
MSPRRRGFAPELTLPRSSWPPDGQAALRRALPADEFEEATNPEAQPLAGATPRLVQQAAERFMEFVRRTRPEMLAQPLDALLTPTNIEDFIAALTGEVTRRTIVDYLERLHMLASRLAPQTSFVWLRRRIAKIGYVTAPPKPSSITAHQVYRLGIAVMDEALVALAAWRRKHGCRPYEPQAIIRYRDGLLLAILVVLAPRIASALAMRLGKTFYLRAATGPYRVRIIDFKSKTMPRKWKSYLIPEELTRYIDIYLDLIRPEFRAAKTSDAFWLSRCGALTYQGAYLSFARTMARGLGVPGHPHMVRGLIGDLMRRAGAAADEIASMLGHASLETAPKYYCSEPGTPRRDLLARISGI